MINTALSVMKSLNSKSSKLMHKYDVSSATDVTGYGLIGHLIEMARGSKLSAEITFNKIQFIKGVKSLIGQKIFPSGAKRNLEFYNSKINYVSNINFNEKLLLADAQTSGGLLISIPKKNVSGFLKEYNKSSEFLAVEIGNFKKLDKNKFLIIK